VFKCGKQEKAVSTAVITLILMKTSVGKQIVILVLIAMAAKIYF